MGLENRDVSGFHSVVLREFGELILSQGDRESLSIEADDEILPKIITEVNDGVLQIGIGRSWLDRVTEAISSTVSSQPIRFRLQVCDLKELIVRGAALVKASRIETDHLSLVLRGAGRVEIGNLTARSLSVRLPGAGEITIAGSVVDQDVEIRGVGSYTAPRLACRTGSIVLAGAGKALLRAEDKLNIVLRGIGSVDYYGRPEISKSVSGLGTVSALEGPGPQGPDPAQNGNELDRPGRE